MYSLTVQFKTLEDLRDFTTIITTSQDSGARQLPPVVQKILPPVVALPQNIETQAVDVIDDPEAPPFVRKKGRSKKTDSTAEERAPEEAIKEIAYEEVAKATHNFQRVNGRDATIALLKKYIGDDKAAVNAMSIKKEKYADYIAEAMKGIAA